MDTIVFLSAPAFSIACLLVVMLGCVGGVVSYQFDDTLLQRLGMAVACLGALVQTLFLLDAPKADPHAALLYAGLAVYAPGTAIKYWRRWRRAGRPGHPFRRSTDFGPDTFGADAPANAHYHAQRPTC